MSALCALLGITVIATTAGAVGTRTFSLTTLDDLKGGDLRGASIDSAGNVRAGLTLGSVPVSDASSAWSSVALDDGTVLVGTGNEGKVYRLRGADVSVAATTGELGVSAMTTAWNGAVIAGTFPDGKLYRIAANAKDGAAATGATLFVALPETEDVWGLAYDAKARALYAATGPHGKLFRIDESGKAEVYFTSDDAHLTSVAVADDGTVVAGSNGKALLYKLTGPGRATVLYDFDADDVKAVAFGKSGTLFAIANKYGEAFAPPKRNKAGTPAPQPTKAAHPGKGQLVRFGRDGIAETMLTDDESHFVSLAVGDDGLPYVGTGVEGRLYTVDENHVSRLVANTDERQVGVIAMAGKRRYIVTSDPVVFHEVKGIGGVDAVWTSKVLDAGLRASFGRLGWRSEGTVELSTRSGNTAVPDGTWSPWSVGLTAPGRVASAPARYVQVRARWNHDPNAALRDVALSFVTDNARAIVTSLEAAPRNQPRSLKMGVVASGGEAPKPSSMIKVTWRVENPDQDELRYRLSYRLDGEHEWRNALKPGEKLTKTEYEWDTTSLPEGNYRLMVEASDELANPPERVTRHSLESGVVLVDNTPPVFKALALAGRRLTGEVVDGLGPIARIEVSVAGSDEWRPLFPKDGIFDEPAEAFDADVSSIVPPGPHLVAVRAYDSAGNSVTRDIEAK